MVTVNLQKPNVFGLVPYEGLGPQAAGAKKHTSNTLQIGLFPTGFCEHLGLKKHSGWLVAFQTLHVLIKECHFYFTEARVLALCLPRQLNCPFMVGPLLWKHYKSPT
ncbi:UNVERIFIED_CONTAM: hypothetical protein K2H54_030830 [Gekko kuhli]